MDSPFVFKDAKKTDACQMTLLAYPEQLRTREFIRFSGIFRDAPPNVGRIANPTYAAPPDMLPNHGDSQ